MGDTLGQAPGRKGLSSIGEEELEDIRKTRNITSVSMVEVNYY